MANSIGIHSFYKNLFGGYYKGHGAYVGPILKPMTVEVIRKINSLEAIQSLTFRYRDIEVGDEESDINGLDDQECLDQVLDGLEDAVI